MLPDPNPATATIGTSGGSNSDVSYYIALLHLVVIVDPNALNVSSSSSSSKSNYRSCIVEDGLLSDPKPTAVDEGSNGDVT